MLSRDPRCTSLATVSTALCLLVACTFTSIGVPVYAQSDAGDSSILAAEEILLKVFDATGGLRWTQRSNWLQSPDVCSFYGVTCYEEDFPDQARRGHIQQLDLSDNHLVGTIPDEVFHLPYIESIMLRDNGDLFMNFDEIGRAEYLTSLIISDTHVKNLDGIEQAPLLETLHITSLGIGTSIPSGIFQLYNLKGLFANFNDFTGKLPAELGNLKAMTELYLFENDLTGEIPTEIGLLTDLETMSLGSNDFSGNLPTELNMCTKLKKLAVERAPGGEKGPGITGSLPSLNALYEITEVYFDHQKLNGPIPEDFLASAPLQQVITVDLTNNEISGSVPDSLTKFERMTLYLADNEIESRTDSFCSKISGWMGGDVGDSTLGCDTFLCPKGTAAPDGRKTETESCETCADALYFGSSSCSTTAEGEVNERAILVSFYNTAGGRYWKQSDNWLNPAESVCNWFGIDCTEDGKVSNINMKNNDLTDTPPEELFTLPELQILDLSSNSLKFKFTGIDKATKLEILDLTQCDMESLDGIENIKSTVFRKLSVASNYLQGAVPLGLFSLISLQELDISHNRFSGVLPSQIGNLVSSVELFT
jgi:Leucine-rich repeat (LRR) protein